MNADKPASAINASPANIYSIAPPEMSIAANPMINSMPETILPAAIFLTFLNFYSHECKQSNCQEGNCIYYSIFYLIISITVNETTVSAANTITSVVVS
ncbi:MAG TPA: hypothetical protein VLB04_08935, partial [Methanotrichaceae archaeon]|nr:hypothetical protein [Methanotrichaceae archaeon]